ncbi:DUF4276 family protein [Desulfoscipio geothermicus]|nr:DUF4276 family protein [Desulfoscipio geothermicus]
MKKIIPGYQKIGGARTIAGYLNIELNRSNSFLIFIEDVKKVVGVMEKDN